MNLTEAIRKFNDIKKGTYTNLVYCTEIPVKAEFKDKIRITKYSNATARFGINYGNLASVKNKEKSTEDTKKKNSNKKWILKDIIEYNTNTDKFYLNVYNSPNKSKSIFIIKEEGKGTRTVKDLTTVEDYILKSYLNKKDCPSTKEFYKVNLDNVISIG